MSRGRAFERLRCATRAGLLAMWSVIAACSTNAGNGPSPNGGDSGSTSSGASNSGSTSSGASNSGSTNSGAATSQGTSGNGASMQAGSGTDSNSAPPGEDGSHPALDASIDENATPAGDDTGNVGQGMDAALVDASQPPPPNPEASTGTSGCVGLFCEDFESGQINPAIWDTKTFAGQTVAVESTTVAHGKYAVQFHASPNTVSYDFIITKTAPAALSKHFFGRASFYITPNPPAGHMELFFAGTQGFPNLKYIEVATAGTPFQLTWVDLKVAAGQATSSTGTQEKYTSGGTVPPKKWACLEWEVNDSPDQETLYVDGTQVVTFSNINLNGTTSGLVGGFADFGFGYYAWHPASVPIDIYYDDIVLDTKRIGCPQ